MPPRKQTAAPNHTDWESASAHLQSELASLTTRVDDLPTASTVADLRVKVAEFGTSLAQLSARIELVEKTFGELTVSQRINPPSLTKTEYDAIVKEDGGAEFRVMKTYSHAAMSMPEGKEFHANHLHGVSTHVGMGLQLMLKD